MPEDEIDPYFHELIRELLDRLSKKSESGSDWHFLGMPEDEINPDFHELIRELLDRLSKNQDQVLTGILGHTRE